MVFENGIWNKRFKKIKLMHQTLTERVYLAKDLKNKKERVEVTQVRQRFHEFVFNDKPQDRNYQISSYLSRQRDVDEGIIKIICDWDTAESYFYATDYGETDLSEYISNVFGDNGKIFQIMNDKTSNNPHPWLSDMQIIFQQMVKSVHWMHCKGVCHLDLSLKNIMIHKMAGLKVKTVKICNFYSALYLKNRLFLYDQNVGTVGYVAPEVQDCHKKKYDARKADVWSLGMILFVMLIGNPPYGDEFINIRRHDITNGVIGRILENWKNRGMLNQDAFDCINRIFRLEEKRLSMKELMCHPFVGLKLYFIDKNALLTDGFLRNLACIQALDIPRVIIPVIANFSFDLDVL